ncbi:WXG100 family type VII secretion target [Actinotalea sp. M2MS4P-6]|uniref:WXG100 family type VII secretion target n=1 Tax=Actinotalea sp. M2MS4P-6 TaxID=2983762 RepID=UPI0021E4C060|nr:WXG100 family type VII secretion target [Actinotalea sp. M2MS4P-6]MCV2394552.1 WXG100 family type VII secretion target [Actinotalea sp. M2MS4P-6]
MAVGAELSTLQDLHKTFVAKADEALQIQTQVQSALDGAQWTGKYSEDFRSAWVEYKKNLNNLADALTGAAKDVQTNHNNIAAATGEPDRI